MRVLIVDDEPPSRALLAAYLREARADVEIIEAGDAAAALAALLGVDVDAAFLDVDMPGMDGVTLARHLRALASSPSIVFATGAAGHAVDGFDLGAVDYLLKPFRASRVAIALERCERGLAARRAESRMESAANGDANDAAEGPPVERPKAIGDRLWAERDDGARVLVPFARIGWLRAHAGRVRLHGPDGELAVRLPLNDLVARLPADRFVRVHRAWIVNIELVREVMTWDSHSMTLIMRDAAATEIPVGRSYSEALKRIAGW